MCGLKVMRKILNPSQSDILKNRMYISRQIKIFKLNDLSKEWNISWMTMFRYSSEHFRELSRAHARKNWEIEKERNKTLCQICDDPLKGHERCPICTQLIHDYSRHTH